MRKDGDDRTINIRQNHENKIPTGIWRVADTGRKDMLMHLPLVLGFWRILILSSLLHGRNGHAPEMYGTGRELPDE
jgi:hypothetical protein